MHRNPPHANTAAWVGSCKGRTYMVRCMYAHCALRCARARHATLQSTLARMVPATRANRVSSPRKSLSRCPSDGACVSILRRSVQEGLAGTAFSAAPVANGQVRTMRIRESGTAGRKPRTTPPLPAVACLHFPEQAFAKLTNSAADLVCTSTLALDRLSCRADARCRGDAADRFICNFCIGRVDETGKARGVLQSGVSRPQHGGIASRADPVQPARNVMSPYQASAVSPVLSVSVETITPLTDAGSVPKARR